MCVWVGVWGLLERYPGPLAVGKEGRWRAAWEGLVGNEKAKKVIKVGWTHPDKKNILVSVHTHRDRLSVS